SLLCSLDYPPLFSMRELLCFITRKRKTTLFQRDLHQAAADSPSHQVAAVAIIFPSAAHSRSLPRILYSDRATTSSPFFKSDSILVDLI
ncbi:hypothetical protein A2U01_0030479, partial [Trifolium medium]|nr:hypothetical protein [Trifolium medium]